MHIGIIFAIFALCSIEEITCETEPEYDEKPTDLLGVFRISPSADKSLVLTNTNKKSSDRPYAHFLVSTEAYSPDRDDNQRWEIKFVPKNEQSPDDDEEKFRIKVDGAAVDYSEMSTFLAEPPVAFPSEVQWILDEIEEGTFVIKSAGPAEKDKCLTFNGFGQYISKLDCTGEENQNWTLLE